jgi:hypothetical protein
MFYERQSRPNGRLSSGILGGRSAPERKTWKVPSLAHSFASMPCTIDAPGFFADGNNRRTVSEDGRSFAKYDAPGLAIEQHVFPAHTHVSTLQYPACYVDRPELRDADRNFRFNKSLRLIKVGQNSADNRSSLVRKLDHSVLRCIAQLAYYNPVRLSLWGCTFVT